MNKGGVNTGVCFAGEEKVIVVIYIGPHVLALPAVMVNEDACGWGHLCVLCCVTKYTRK